MQNKLIPIKDIEINDLIYPRTMFNWKVAQAYTHAMRMGAVFPPITVTRFEGKILLIDGRHRIIASKKNKNSHIGAEFIEVKNLKDAYVEALKRNIAHGQTLSIYEKMLAYKKLKEDGFSLIKISGILQIPQNLLIKYASQKMIISSTGEEVVLKRPLQNLGGQLNIDITKDDQNILSADSQLRIINELITLIKNRWLDRKNKKVKRALKILRGII
jgi:ParB-like chromosome segregation protein Spo0J